VDPFAAWCGVLREHGEVMDNHFGYAESPLSPLSPLALTRTWCIPHEEIDGARGIPRLLGEVGKPVPPVPRSREARPPPLLARAASLVRELRDPPRPAVPWRRFDPAARGTTAARLAHAFFDRRATEALASRAEAEGATTNARLLWALDRAVYPVLAHPMPLHRWAVAVNLLGAARGAETMATAAALVGVLLPEAGSSRDVRRALGDRLRAHAHWGAWDAMHLLGALGVGAMRRYADRYYARPGHSWVGGFSNVGAWDVDGGYWYALQPVTRTQPVGAAAVTVGGRLGLALQVHPALGEVSAADLMGRWRGVLEGDLL
jgi:hypothetical protein